MARDDFTAKIKDELSKRAGSRCSNPDCRRVTGGPSDASDGTVNVGVAAHVTAASAGGPRFDPDLTSEQRGAASNGIWLCQTCAKLIDNDIEAHPVDVLRAWKTLREHDTRQEVRGKPISHLPPAPLSVELDWKLQDGSDGARHDYQLRVMARNEGESPLVVESAEIKMPMGVVTRPTEQHQFVRDRSDGDVAFFRNTQGATILPGDRVPVAGANYYLDASNHRDRGDLLDRPVEATVRTKDHRPVTAQRRFGDLQKF